MVVRMNWKMLVRYLVVALVVLGLLGNISLACQTNDEAECSSEIKKTQTIDGDDEEAGSSEVDVLKDTWLRAFLIFLERLFERYPIFREILQMIFA